MCVAYFANHLDEFAILLPVNKGCSLGASIIWTMTYTKLWLLMSNLISVLVFNITFLTFYHQLFDCVFGKPAHFFVIFNQNLALAASAAVFQSPFVPTTVAEKCFTAVALTHLLGDYTRTKLADHEW